MDLFSSSPIAIFGQFINLVWLVVKAEGLILSPRPSDLAYSSLKGLSTDNYLSKGNTKIKTSLSFGTWKNYFLKLSM